MLVDPVVVAGDGAATDVDPAADLGITEVGEMAGLAPLADGRFLGLDEVADLVLPGQHGSRPQVSHRTDVGIGTDGRFTEHRTGLDMDPVGQGAIRDDHAGIDLAFPADDRTATQMGTGMDDGVRADDHVRLDVGGGRIDQGDTVAHVPLVDPLAHHPPRLGQLDPVVDAHRLLRVCRRQCRHLFPGSPGSGDHVGQVVFPLGVVVGQAGQQGEDPRRGKYVDAGIDLADGTLAWGGILLLDNALDTVIAADDPPVAVRVGKVRGQHRDRGALFTMVGQQSRQRGSAQQRHIAAQQQQLAAKTLKGRHGAAQGMPGTKLFGLQGEIHPAPGKSLPNQLRTMADHRDHRVGTQGPGRTDHVGQQWFSGNRVQNLGSS